MWKVAVILIVVITAVAAIGAGLFVLLTAIGTVGTGNRPAAGFPETPNIFVNGVSLNGAWEIEALTYNDEFITIVFDDSEFIKVSEMHVMEADIDQVIADIEDIREFYRNHNGGEVEVGETENGVLLRVTVGGIFSLTDNEIWMASGEDIVTIMPFSWDGIRIVINDDSFVRR
jgi:hypothetical protein